MIGIFCGNHNRQPEAQKETEREIFRLGHRSKNDPEPLVGSPVLFGSRYFADLCTLPESKGGNVLLRKYPSHIHTVYIADRNELADADTPDALAKLEALALQKKLNVTPPYRSSAAEH